TTWFMLPDNTPNVLASRGALAPGQEPGAINRPGADAVRLANRAIEGGLDSTSSVVPSTANDVGSDSVPTGVGVNAAVGMESQPMSVVPLKSERSWTERATILLRPWLGGIVAVWSIGVVLCSLRPLLGWRTLWRLKRVGVSSVSDDVLAAMSRVS